MLSCWLLTTPSKPRRTRALMHRLSLDLPLVVGVGKLPLSSEGA